MDIALLSKIINESQVVIEHHVFFTFHNLHVTLRVSKKILRTMENDGTKVVDFMLGDFPTEKGDAYFTLNGEGKGRFSSLGVYFKAIGSSSQFCGRLWLIKGVHVPVRPS